MKRVVIVCGGRDYADRACVFATLDRLHAEEPITRIRHGGATGADTLAGQWARDRGISERVYRADWSEHGRAAGPIRNEDMARRGAALCVAFPGGAGTADMVRRAHAHGIRVIFAGDHRQSR